MRRRLFSVVGTGLMSCGGGFDTGAIDHAISSAEAEADPVAKKHQLMASLLPAEVGVLSGACADAWSGFADTAPEDRSRKLVSGLGGKAPLCPNACDAEDFEAIGHVMPNDRMMIVEGGCSPATMFADPRLKPLRERFDVGDFFVMHALTEPILVAGGPAADRLKALAPSVAVGMVSGPLPIVDTDSLEAHWLQIESDPKSADYESAVLPHVATLTACLVDAPAERIRVVLDVDSKVARVIAPSNQRCWTSAATAIVWPGGSAAVIDIGISK